MSECTHHWTAPSACPYCLRNEIEQLRAENAHLIQTAQGRISSDLHEAALAEKDKEIERLRRYWQDRTERALEAEIDQRDQEIERLRFSLGAIATWAGADNQTAYEMRKIAREVLRK